MTAPSPDPAADDDRRDRVAEAVLKATHTHDWYVGDATTAEWEAAYEAADKLLATIQSDGSDTLE